MKLCSLDQKRIHGERLFDMPRKIWKRMLNCRKDFMIGILSYTFNSGDWLRVLYPPELQTKVEKGWIEPFLVIKRLGDVHYVVQKSPKSRLGTLCIPHEGVFT